MSFQLANQCLQFFLEGIEVCIHDRESPCHSDTSPQHCTYTYDFQLHCLVPIRMTFSSTALYLYVWLSAPLPCTYTYDLQLHCLVPIRMTFSSTALYLAIRMTFSSTALYLYVWLSAPLHCTYTYDLQLHCIVPSYTYDFQLQCTHRLPCRIVDQPLKSM